MATDRDRASFEHWHIQRQRSRGYGAFLSDAEFVTRDESGRYRTLGLDDALEAWCAALAAPPVEPTPWLPYLSDRADGVKGHYAIARHNPAGYREVWNLRRHQWAAFSDAVLTMDEALAILQKLTMPTAAPPVEQQAATWCSACGCGNDVCGYAHLHGCLRAATPSAPAPQAGAAELPDQMDAIALARFRVLPTTSGYWGWCVKAGDGEAELYKGHKRDCDLVARRMVGAFLDGGHKALGLLAAHPAEQPSQDADPLQGAANWLSTMLIDFEVRDLQERFCIGYNRARRLFDAARAAQAQGGAK